MTFITTFERLARAEGRTEGHKEVLLALFRNVLAEKFQDEGLALLPALETLDDTTRLETIFHTARKAATLDEVRAALPSP